MLHYVEKLCKTINKKVDQMMWKSSAAKESLREGRLEFLAYFRQIFRQIFANFPIFRI